MAINRGYFIEWECGVDLSADTLHLATETDELSCRKLFVEAVEMGIEDVNEGRTVSIAAAKKRMGI